MNAQVVKNGNNKIWGVEMEAVIASKNLNSRKEWDKGRLRSIYDIAQVIFIELEGE